MSLGRADALPRRLTGRLSADSVEGFGIFLLESELGRVELALTSALRFVSGPARIVDTAGDQVAVPGDWVVVSGATTDEIASIRQQGRMFFVTAIEVVYPPYE